MRPVAFPRALFAAALLWLPNVHRVFDTDQTERAHIASAIASRGSAHATDDANDMRAVNPEWDFMARTFTVLALADRAMDTKEASRETRTAERARDLRTIDAIVDRTLADDAKHGDTYFLLPYAKNGRFRDPEARSVFVDGEIVAMIAARALVEPRQERREEARTRAARIERAMRRSPTFSAESYPNECWTFCNTTALAGLAMLDATEGTDHSDLSRAWVSHAKAQLTDPKTGMLVSSFNYDGVTRDGPEGSTIWMSATNLLFVDEAFASDQYARAKREIGADFVGFGWAREWPKSARARPDVDSGPIVPFLDASAGSSGFAILGASAFADRSWQTELLASLELAGFRDDTTGSYRASNDVGDAVMLYALSFGPLLQRVKSHAQVAEVER